ncbi:MAG: HEAT repeat domain-containing protein [bacterium]|nr:HEAT repeat domain-containing protein [bacterium]
MWVLVVLGISGVVGNFLSALEGPDTPERVVAVDRLVALGGEGVVPMAEALGEVGWRAREGLLEALGRMGPAALPVLMRTARMHPRTDARRHAVLAVGNVRGSAAKDSLKQLLDTPERDLVIEAIGEVGSLVDTALVVRFLRDGNADVRRQAVVALARLAGVLAVERMIDALADVHHGVRYAAAGALGDMDAGEMLVTRLDTLSGPALYLAVRTLGHLQYRPAQKPLERLLYVPDWAVRAVAADALAGIGSKELEQALAHETHPFVRARMVQGLQQNVNP